MIPRIKIMKKTIIKTVIITIVSIILAASLAIGIILAVSPKTIGKVFTKCGNYNTAAKLYENQYKRYESLSDLEELVGLSISAENNQLISVYGERLTVNYKENWLKRENAQEKYDNYAKATVEAYYKRDKKEDCVRVAFSTSDSFIENTSLYYLFGLCDSKEDKDLAYEIFKYNKKNPDSITDISKNYMETRIEGYRKKYDFFYYNK